MGERDEAERRPSGEGEETERERTTRKWNEMLQELRVAQTGVQVITGFLLTVPFTTRFDALEQVDRTAYLITVTASIAAGGLLIGPVAFHRVLFGKSEKPWLIDAANNAARAGLAMLGVTMSGVMWLTFSVVVSKTAAVVATSVTAATLALLWVAVPLLGRARDDQHSP